MYVLKTWKRKIRGCSEVGKLSDSKMVLNRSGNFPSVPCSLSIMPDVDNSLIHLYALAPSRRRVTSNHSSSVDVAEIAVFKMEHWGWTANWKLTQACRYCAVYDCDVIGERMDEGTCKAL